MSDTEEVVEEEVEYVHIFILLCITFISKRLVAVIIAWHVDEFKFKVLLFILCTLVSF